jgi:hypothetical protein
MSDNASGPCQQAKGKERSTEPVENGTEHQLIKRIQELEDALAFAYANTCRLALALRLITAMTTTNAFQTTDVIVKEPDERVREMLAEKLKVDYRDTSETAKYWYSHAFRLIVWAIRGTIGRDSAYDLSATTGRILSMENSHGIVEIHKEMCQKPRQLAWPKLARAAFSNHPVSYPGVDAVTGSQLWKRLGGAHMENFEDDTIKNRRRDAGNPNSRDSFLPVKSWEGLRAPLMEHNYGTTISNYARSISGPSTTVSNASGRGMSGFGPSYHSAMASNPNPLSLNIDPVDAPAINTRAIDTSAIYIPDIDTPAIYIPAISTPAISTPAISTPAIDIPAISTPAISTPAISTPAIDIPAIDTPAADYPYINTQVGGSSTSDVLDSDIASEFNPLSFGLDPLNIASINAPGGGFSESNYSDPFSNFDPGFIYPNNPLIPGDGFAGPGPTAYEGTVQGFTSGYDPQVLGPPTGNVHQGALGYGFSGPDPSGYEGPGQGPASNFNPLVQDLHTGNFEQSALGTAEGLPSGLYGQAVQGRRAGNFQQSASVYGSYSLPPEDTHGTQKATQGTLWSTRKRSNTEADEAGELQAQGTGGDFSKRQRER